jgi:hypothetical protein
MKLFLDIKFSTLTRHLKGDTQIIDIIAEGREKKRWEKWQKERRKKAQYKEQQSKIA